MGAGRAGDGTFDRVFLFNHSAPQNGLGRCHRDRTGLSPRR